MPRTGHIIPFEKGALRYSFQVSVTQSDQLQRRFSSRENLIKVFLGLIILTPIILDFLFTGTRAARLSRILIFILISGFLLIGYEKFLNLKPIGMGTILLILLLYSVGTFSSLLAGGVATANFLSLMLILVIVAFSPDLHSMISSWLGICAHILIALSFIVIVLKFNNLNLFFTDKGYPVFFNFIGIPGRNYGVFAHPNILGEVSVISFLYILSSKSLIRYKLFMVVPLTCILKSGSRTSIIGLVVGIIIYFLFRSKLLSQVNQKITFEFPLIVGLFLSGIFLVLTSILVNLVAYLDPNSLTSRVSIWQTSLDLTKNHLLIGIGWGWQGRAIESQYLNTWEASAHNQILEILFSSGILGLIVFVILIARGFIFFTEMPTVYKTIFITTLVSGISESYIDLQYPNLLTFVFFTILVQARSRSTWTR